MKNIKKYKYTKTAIRVNNEEEYEALVPLLNTIFSGWMSGKYKAYTDGKYYFYINLDSDSVTTMSHDAEVIEAEEFLKLEHEIINNYQIY